MYDILINYLKQFKLIKRNGWNSQIKSKCIYLMQLFLLKSEMASHNNIHKEYGEKSNSQNFYNFKAPVVYFNNCNIHIIVESMQLCINMWEESYTCTYIENLFKETHLRIAWWNECDTTVHKMGDKESLNACL